MVRSAAVSGHLRLLLPVRSILVPHLHDLEAGRPSRRLANLESGKKSWTPNILTDDTPNQRDTNFGDAIKTTTQAQVAVLSGNEGPGRWYGVTADERAIPVGAKRGT